VHHDVYVNVNGLSDRDSRYFLSPALAPLAAPDCTVRGVGGESPNLCDVSTVWVQPANPIRQMSGREAGAYTRSPFRLNVSALCGIGVHLGLV
jgi:hypothetical protein